MRRPSVAESIVDRLLSRDEGLSVFKSPQEVGGHAGPGFNRNPDNHQIRVANRNILRRDAGLSPEACPGCGCEPGDGISSECDHPDGCGYYKKNFPDDVGPHIRPHIR